MLKELIGKDVVMEVGFARWSGQGGNCPAHLTGKILEVSDDFIKMDVVDSDLPKTVHVLSTTYRTGLCFISIKYIIDVFEQ